MSDEKMSENEEDAEIIDFHSKSQKRRIVKELGLGMEKAEISDEDFQVFLDAIFGGYKGGGYLPE